MGQPESHDPTFEIKVLAEAILLEDTSGTVPSTEEHVL